MYDQGLATILKRQQLAESQNLSHTLLDDVLDDLSALVIEKSGRVILLPAEKMPYSGGAVSINRY